MKIGRDQKLFLQDDPVSVEQLERRLKRAKEENADVSVYLRADQSVPYGIVIKVMDGVKRSGIERLGMVTDPSGVEQIREAPIKKQRPVRKQPKSL